MTKATAMLDELKTSRIKPDLIYRGNTCRCVLAEVYARPEGILVHQPVYTLSEGINEQHSTPEGRANNTLDGKNTWQRQVYFIEEGYPNLQCNHILDHRVHPDLLRQDVANSRKEISI